MTRHDQNNPMAPFESLLDEALSAPMPSDDLASRIIAQTAGQNVGTSEGSPLKLVGKSEAMPADPQLEPVLDEALAPQAVSETLIKKILAVTLPISEHVIGRIGPLKVRYATAHRIAAMVVVLASMGIVFQAWGICTDAYHIVQATRHVSSIMKYTAPDTALDQKIDALATEIDQLALTSDSDWNTQVGDMSQSIIGLEDIIESETSNATF